MDELCGSKAQHGLTILNVMDNFRPILQDCQLIFHLNTYIAKRMQSEDEVVRELRVQRPSKSSTSPMSVSQIVL